MFSSLQADVGCMRLTQWIDSHTVNAMLER